MAHFVKAVNPKGTAACLHSVPSTSTLGGRHIWRDTAYPRKEQILTELALGGKTEHSVSCPQVLQFLLKCSKLETPPGRLIKTKTHRTTHSVMWSSCLFLNFKTINKVPKVSFQDIPAPPSCFLRVIQTTSFTTSRRQICEKSHNTQSPTARHPNSVFSLRPSRL